MAQVNFTRFPDGVNNVSDTHRLRQLQLLDPTKYAILYEDFIDFPFGSYPADSDAVALKYAVTLDTELDYDVSYGGSTGSLVLTTEGGDTEGGQFRLNASPFKMVVGKKAWFEIKCTLTAVTVAQYSFFAGLSTNATGTNFIDDAGSALAVDNAWGFVQFDGSANIAAIHRVSDAGTASEGAVHAWTTAVPVVMNLYYDGVQSHVYVNDVLKGTLTGAIPTAAMTFMLHFKSQSVEAGVLDVDYFMAVLER